MTQAFGNFATGMISDPLTLELGEIKHHATLRVGYEADPVTASMAVLKGDVQKIGKDDINTIVASIGAAGEVNDSFSYGIGASYISNIGDTDGLQDNWEGSGSETDEMVGGYSVYGIAGFGGFELRAEYLAVADEFSDGDMAGMQPSAWNFEAGYDFSVPLHLALRYAGAEDFGVEHQYGATLAYDITEEASVVFEYLHMKSDADEKTDMLTLQLAMDSGHHGEGRRRSARLSEMGFSPGQIVEVLQNSPGVPLLLRVRDGKMAVDKRTAMEIIVRRISS